MRKSRAWLVLVAVAIGVILGAVFLRGEPPAPESPDLPSVAIDTE